MESVALFDGEPLQICKERRNVLKLSLVKDQPCSTVLHQLGPLNKILLYTIKQGITVFRLAGDKSVNHPLGNFSWGVFPYTRYIAQMEERSFTNSTTLRYISHMLIKNHTNVLGRVWGADRIIDGGNGEGNENGRKWEPKTSNFVFSELGFSRLRTSNCLCHLCKLLMW